MLPGPTHILQCSECSRCFKRGTLSSGNNFGRKYWTDGEFTGSRFYAPPQLVKCPHCQMIIWLQDQNKVNEIPNYLTFLGKETKADKSLTDLPFYEDASETELAAFLEVNSPQTDREAHARTMLWRLGNNKRRTGVESPLSDLEIKNLQKLVEISSAHDDESVLLKIEMLRELGKFEDAQKLLDFNFTENYQHIAEAQQQFLEQRTSTMWWVPSEDRIFLAQQWLQRKVTISNTSSTN
jgi:hypothetical protein